jgi:hypothetical protein
MDRPSMKRLLNPVLVCTAASLLALAGAATVAWAGCVDGVRVPPVAGDLCLNRAGTQTADTDLDNFGDDCDFDSDQTCSIGIDDYVTVFLPAWAQCSPPFGDPDYDPAVDFNQDGCVGAPDLLTLGMNFGMLSFYPDAPN